MRPHVCLCMRSRGSHGTPEEHAVGVGGPLVRDEQLERENIKMQG